jgi:ATP-binding cassette, subfamily B, bacterial
MAPPGRPDEKKVSTQELLEQLPRTLALVWKADKASALGVGALTLLQALLPGALAWVGKLIIDAVVLAAQSREAADLELVYRYVGIELALAVAALGLGRLTGFVRELLRVNLGNLINEQILTKSLSLELRHFEDSKTYDVMQNARREASMRPLSLALAGLTVIKNLITLATFGVLLWTVAWWSVGLLLFAAIPAFIAETRLSGEAFRLYSWRAPEGRRLNYLEWILTRDSHVKEVKLYDLGPLVQGRYRGLFSKFLAEDRKLARRRLLLGTLFGAISLAAFYACYLAVAGRAARGEISLGDLTLGLAVFRQGQAAFEAVLGSVAGMYEDALFMSNLFLFLALPTSAEKARVDPPRPLPSGQAAIEFRGVSFKYPGREGWALEKLTLTIGAGEKLALVGENGAGKSTVVKLLMRLYEPSEGEILYGGIDLRDFDVKELRARFGAVFQDFVRYQFNAGENIGLGDVAKLDHLPTVQRAAKDGGADELVESLPQKYDTVLGGWFEKGHELSGGQWQKLAISRAFMRDAQILILDEPTASIDAEAEVALFDRFKRLAADRSAIIISHRFSTVRMADRIAVLERGKLSELGSHEELVARNGRYAHLFALQAQGYR